MNPRNYSLTDRLLGEANHALNVLSNSVMAERPTPSTEAPPKTLNLEAKQHSREMMRVNHTGEVCAQALYQGAALVARDEQTRQFLLKASQEEIDHLAWCYERLQELKTHPSYFNLFWYTNSFLIGMISGLFGDQWSLGFVDETEKQVEAHLDDHLQRLSEDDSKSRKIVEVMQADEIAHSQKAQKKGARELPPPIKLLMKVQAKVMTTLAAKI